MIISLEGHSYTGKSSLLKLIGENDGFAVVPETDVYAGGIENYPPFPALTEEMAVANVDFFASLEDERKKDADDALRDVATDRTFLSVVLFQKFIRRLQREGWHDAYDYAKSLYHQRINEDRVIIPDAMCLVSCASDADYKSRLGREISVQDLQTVDAYRFFTDEYARAFAIYRDMGRMVRFVNANGEDSLSRGVSMIEQMQVSEMSIDQKKRIAHEVLERI